jgi:hypothetical protein
LEEQSDRGKASDKADDDAIAAQVEKFAKRPMQKPSAANKADEEELEKIGGASQKLKEFMQRKIDAEMRKALGK